MSERVRRGEPSHETETGGASLRPAVAARATSQDLTEIVAQLERELAEARARRDRLADNIVWWRVATGAATPDEARLKIDRLAARLPPDRGGSEGDRVPRASAGADDAPDRRVRCACPATSEYDPPCPEHGVGIGVAPARGDVAEASRVRERLEKLEREAALHAECRHLMAARISTLEEAVGREVPSVISRLASLERVAHAPHDLASLIDRLERLEVQAEEPRSGEVWEDMGDGERVRLTYLDRLPRSWTGVVERPGSGRVAPVGAEVSRIIGGEWRRVSRNDPAREDGVADASRVDGLRERLEKLERETALMAARISTLEKATGRDVTSRPESPEKAARAPRDFASAALEPLQPGSRAEEPRGGDVWEDPGDGERVRLTYLIKPPRFWRCVVERPGSDPVAPVGAEVNRVISSWRRVPENDPAREEAPPAVARP